MRFTIVRSHCQGDEQNDRDQGNANGGQDVFGADPSDEHQHHTGAPINTAVDRFAGAMSRQMMATGVMIGRKPF